jgi:hypothetical protein
MAFPGIVFLLVAAFSLSMFTRVVSSEPRTLVFDYSIERYVKNPDGTNGEPEFVKGNFALDTPSRRAIDSSSITLPSGKVWLGQKIFDADTAISITRLDANATGVPDHPHKDEIVVEGRNGRNSDDWRVFLAQSQISPATGYFMAADTPRHFSETIRHIQDGNDISDTEFVDGGFRFTISRTEELGNRLSRLAWSYADDASVPKKPGLTASANMSFKRIFRSSEHWIPEEFSIDLSMSGGIFKMPEGRKIRGKTEIAIPDKRIVSNIVISNIKMDQPLKFERFLADLEDGHRAVNLDARHIEHVFVKNKLIPKADAVAQAMISNSNFQPVSPFRKLLLFSSLAIFILVTAIVLRFRLHTNKL